MSYGLIDYDTIHSIADALRNKTNYNGNYYPRDMARAINNLSAGGGFSSPIMYSIKAYKENTYDDTVINFRAAVSFEIVNELPSYVTIIDNDAQWSQSSENIPLTFYYRGGSYNTQEFVWNQAKADNEVYPYDLRNVTKGGLILGLYTNSPNINKTSIMSMDTIFQDTSNITVPICGPYTTSMKNAYAWCSNLLYPVCGNNVEDLAYAYIGCYNIRSANVGPNVKNLYSAYSACLWIDTDVEIEKAFIITNAFSGCNNIKNIYLGSELVNKDSYVQNAFYRSWYNHRRNIVVRHNTSYNYLTNYAIGADYDDEEVYQTPININVNNHDYSVVKCKYNTQRNIYVYCMEE